MICPTCDQMLEIDILGTGDDWECPRHGPIRVKQEVSKYRQQTRAALKGQSFICEPRSSLAERTQRASNRGSLGEGGRVRDTSDALL